MIIQRERAVLDVLRQAGGEQPELVSARRQVHRQQHEALGRVLAPLYEAGSLRKGVDLDGAIASFSVLASPECYWLAVDELGWSAARWERWLADSTARLLLD